MKRDLLLWIGLLGGPLVWLMSFQARFALVPWACVFQTKLALFSVTLLALIGSGAATFIAWRQWKLLGSSTPADTGGTLDRSRSMALGGIALSGLSCILIVAQFIPEVALGICQ